MNEFTENFVKDIPRGVTSRLLNRQTVPQARWASPEAILQSKVLAYDPDNPGGKILVGAMGPKLLGIADNRHILTVAGSRAGKSVSIVGNLLFYRGSVLATDPKAELANITAERRAALGQKVFVLDPFKTASERLARFRAGYNPLAILTPDSPTIMEDASLVADAIVVQSGADRDPHWDESAKNFIEGVILHVVTDKRFAGRRNLLTVRDLIRTALVPEDGEDLQADEEPIPVLERAMLENAERLEASEATRDLAGTIEGAARDFFEKSDRERDSVLSTVRRHTKFLDYRALRGVLASHDFSLADLKRERAGVTVYLCFPASRMSICDRWLRIFVNQLLAAMEQEKAAPPAPVLVCLDEFPVLGYMRQLENATGQIASFGVKLWVVLQDWNQGKALYKERWESFAGNAGILQFFGNNDLATTEYISRRLGRTRVGVTRDHEVGPDQRQAGQTGRSEAIELHDLLTPEEISRQFARGDRLRRQLVIWAGYHPMILQRVEYFDQQSVVGSNFKGKYAISI